MPGRSVGCGMLRAFKPILAILLASLVFGVALSVKTLGAPWELRIDIPGAILQQASDISPNRQYVVGFYSTAQGHSDFLWHAGTLSTISIAGADAAVTGVNARGDVVGFAFFPDGGTEMAFLRRTDGTITPISCPSPLTIIPAAVNNGGVVVGSWGAQDDIRTGFRWWNGYCEPLPIQDGLVSATDISESGIIIGLAGARDEFDPFYSFMIKGDEVITVEHPEALFATGGLTALTAVAANGLAVGWSSPSVSDLVRGDLRWFVYRDGLFESIAVPVAAREFDPLSISPSGVITYEDADDVIRALRVSSALAQF